MELFRCSCARTHSPCIASLLSSISKDAPPQVGRVRLHRLVGLGGRRSRGWIRGGTSTRRSYDEFAVEQDVAGEHVGMLDALEHGRHGGVADFPAGLMNGRE